MPYAACRAKARVHATGLTNGRIPMCSTIISRADRIPTVHCKKYFASCSRASRAFAKFLFRGLGIPRRPGALPEVGGIAL